MEKKKVKFQYCTGQFKNSTFQSSQYFKIILIKSFIRSFRCKTDCILWWGEVKRPFFLSFFLIRKYGSTINFSPCIFLPTDLLSVSWKIASYRSWINILCQIPSPFYLLTTFQKCHVTFPAILLIWVLLEYLCIG